MIYSASRRTDLVRFHPDWLAARIGRARRLDAIVFWTKDPTALVAHPGLARIVATVPTLVQLTVTGRAGDAWEPGVSPPERWADALAELSRRLPAGAVHWRFDPIVWPRDTLADAVTARFRRVLEFWTAATGAAPREVTTSFLAPYARVRDALAARGLSAHAPTAVERRALLAALWHEMGGGDAVVRLCCVPELADLPFTAPARCVDAARLDACYGTRLSVLPRDAGQRKACACSQSTDIGAYTQACGHRCAYCYANHAFDEPPSTPGREGGLFAGTDRGNVGPCMEPGE